MTRFSLSFQGTEVGVLTHLDGGWTYISEYELPTADMAVPEFRGRGLTLVSNELPDFIHLLPLLPDFSHSTIRRVIADEGINDELGVLLRFRQPKDSAWKLRLQPDTI